MSPVGPEREEAPGGKGERQRRLHQRKGKDALLGTVLLRAAPPLTLELIFQENDENGEPEVDDDDEEEVDEEDEEDEGDGE